MIAAAPAEPCLRTAARTPIERPSTLRADGSGPVDIAVLDLSATGFAFESETPIAVGTEDHVGLAGAGRADAEIAWTDGERHGCTFRTPLTPDKCDAAFRGSAVVRLLPAAPAPDASSPSLPSRRSLAPPMRYVLAALAGGAGWFGVAALLRIALA
ncbi:PilZ domain-containing protein [Sphingomonas sp. MMS24-JH45]